MRIHHLNCGTMCPVGGRFMDGRTSGVHRARLVCHCLLVEAADRLILVDTGLGTADVRHPQGRLSSLYLHLLGVTLRPEETAIRQLERRGFDPKDVRDIVLTHLDFDHAGGLSDFPHATVHVLRPEVMAARRRATPVARGRYRPQQWRGVDQWAIYDDTDGEPWFGFEAVRSLRGLPPELLMVPLSGHTWGHAGIAVDTGDGWLLHAGDAYFFGAEMDPQHPWCTPGLRGYQRLMEVDRDERLRNQRRLRSLVRHHGHEVTVFSAHDAEELDRLRIKTVPAAPEDRSAARLFPHP